MNLPIFSIEGLFTPEMQFLPALIIGFFFGFALERAGFGKSNVLAAQFYLYDMRVFKVMFTAIITASVGVAFFESIGILDRKLIFVSGTFILPHIIGGFLLGVGFVVSGYCPGTSVVGFASGKWDALVAYIGIVIGSVIFAELYPVIKPFYLSTSKGVLYIPDSLGVPYGLVSVIIVIVAIFAFFGAEKVEKIFAKKLNKEAGTEMGVSGKRILFSIAGVGVLSLILFFAIPKQSITPQKNITQISAIELAQSIIEKPNNLHIIDMRNKPQCEEKGKIPLSICFDDVKENIGLLYSKKQMVIYGDDELKDIPKEIYKFKGDVFVLKGGLKSWRALMLGEGIGIDDKDKYSREFIASLSAYFTGTKSTVSTEQSAPKPTLQRAPKKKGGCS